MNETPPANPPAKNNGMPAIAWVGIGCGTLLVIAVIVVALFVSWCKHRVGDLSEFKNNPEKAAAELMVRMNPDLTKVGQDDAKGEMTIRTKDGEEMTLSYKDISEGKFTFKDAKGNVTTIGHSDLSELPSWVPRVPNIKSTNSAMQTHGEDGNAAGNYSATTSESIDAADTFFKAAAKKLDLTESNRTSFKEGTGENRIVTYEGNGRQLNVILNTKPDANLQVTVSYDETKPSEEK